MEFEVGMYVRTKWGILKIDKLLYGVMEDAKKHLHFGDFKKASHNIIDLIEVGDYVNGKEVAFIDDFTKEIAICETDLTTRDFEGRYAFKRIKKEDIKSIVTKESFSSMEYKVGE